MACQELPRSAEEQNGFQEFGDHKRYTPSLAGQIPAVDNEDGFSHWNKAGINVKNVAAN